MTKRTGSIERPDLTDEIESALGDFVQTVTNIGNVAEYHVNGVILHGTDDSLQRLIDSDIITATDSELTWRTGHLEHLANLYAANPAQTWRDYADDLTVALAHDARFAGMVDKARGE